MVNPARKDQILEMMRHHPSVKPEKEPAKADVILTDDVTVQDKANLIIITSEGHLPLLRETHPKAAKVTSIKALQEHFVKLAVAA